MEYDSGIHHRRSIRLKGHDYAVGGTYFVTLCAHREFVNAAGGKPFAVPPIRKIIQEQMCVTADRIPNMKWSASVIMPDHFHALIRIYRGGNHSLGEILGAFKSAISREIRRMSAGEEGLEKEGGKNPARTGEACLALSAPGAKNEASSAPIPAAIRIWHRNYYEMIVRSAEAEAGIAQYIRMNPWRCVQNFGAGLRGMGNPALFNREKTGVLCSRGAPPIGALPDASVYMSGFHSPGEKEIFARLLAEKRAIIRCPAWKIDTMKFEPAVLDALENNRMLLLEMTNVAGNIAAAEERNRFIAQHAETLWLPFVQPGGMLEKVIRDTLPHTQRTHSYGKT